MKKQKTLAVSTHCDAPYLMSFKYLPAHISRDHEVLVPLEVLAQSDGYCEYWFDQAETTLVKTSQLTQVMTPMHLVLIFDVGNEPIGSMVANVYRRAYQVAMEQDFPHLLRTWNYIHDINGVDDDVERYQSFCIARHAVLNEFNQLQQPNPAATAIGSHNEQNCFVFLFSQNPGQVIENKRQVSAWQYPEKYSPKQPRFSRAMAVDGMLLCSGTASVVGHETVQLNNTEGQFVECMKNVDQLLSTHDKGKQLASGIYRFYLRDKQRVDSLKKMIEEQGIEQYIILHGDICRKNLLLECEVVFQ